MGVVTVREIRAGFATPSPLGLLATGLADLAAPESERGPVALRHAVQSRSADQQIFELLS
jgi:hypothetical protein